MEREPVFNTILVCCDLSEHADTVAHTAAVLAAKLEANVLLAHVCGQMCPSPFTVAWQMPGTFATSASFEQSKHVEAIMHLQQIFCAAGVPCRVLDEVGDPADRILAAAERNHVNLIVIGCQGERELMSLGPVADYVAHNAECPVLIVR